MWENIIDWHARRGPDEIAIRTGDSVLTYGVFARHIAQVTCALERENLPTGVVVIATPHAALQWLFTFALERLGRTSLFEISRIEDVARLVGASVVITTDPGLRIDGVRVLHVTPEWRGQAFSNPPSERRSSGAPEDLVRIVLSSGTTGERKQIPIRRSVIDARLGHPLAGFPSPRVKGLQSIGMDTIGGFWQPLATWLNGGECQASPSINADLLRAQAPNWSLISPAVLKEMLPLVSSIYSPEAPIGLLIGGSAIPPSLVQALSDQPSVHATVIYGSTEAGTTATAPLAAVHGRPGATGYPAPWVAIEVVDENGATLPQGQSGIIRIRGAGVVDGYLQDGVVIPFPDGWFYPNDIGHIDRDGMLVIDGRVDDVVNVGGVKLSSTRLEETLLACPDVSDAAIVMFPMTSGRWALHAAVVSSNYQPEPLAAAVRERHRVDVILTQVDVIPRNGMGKIVREAVRQEILRRRPSSAQAAPGPADTQTSTESEPARSPS